MLSSLELQFLSVISKEKYCYGLEIAKTIQEISDKSFVCEGSIYTTLARLEKKGYVKSRADVKKVKRRGVRRKYYYMTDRGKLMLEDNKNMFLRLWGLV